jgi:hypothetical protein
MTTTNTQQQQNQQTVESFGSQNPQYYQNRSIPNAARSMRVNQTVEQRTEDRVRRHESVLLLRALAENAKQPRHRQIITSYCDFNEQALKLEETSDRIWQLTGVQPIVAYFDESAVDLMELLTSQPRDNSTDSGNTSNR